MIYLRIIINLKDNISLNFNNLTDISIVLNWYLVHKLYISESWFDNSLIGNIISQEEVDGEIVVNCLLEVLIGALKNEEQKEIIDAHSPTLAEDILETFTRNVKKANKEE
jgi:hypothetical protein